MNLQEAIAKAAQILDEERASPTVSYEPNPRELSDSSDLSMQASAIAADHVRYGIMDDSFTTTSTSDRQPTPLGL